MYKRMRSLTFFAVLLTCSFVAMAEAPTAGVEALVTAVGAKADPSIVNEPFSIDFTPDGTMYGVEFTKANRVFKMNAQGKVEFIAGQFWNSEGKGVDNTPNDGADPLKARFNALHDIAISPKGDAYLAETYANRIRKLNLQTGEVITLAGDSTPGFAGDGGPLKDARFRQSYCVALSADASTIYVADIGNARIRALDLVKGTISTVAGNGKKGAAVDGAPALETPLNGPRACTIARDGTLYIVQREGNSLLAVKNGILHVVVNSSGAKGYAGDGSPAKDAKLNGPKYVCMDPHDNVILVDTENHCLRRYEPATGKIVLVAGTPPKAGGKLGNDLLSTELKRPHGARFDKQGRIYIADSENNRVLRAAYP